MSSGVRGDIPAIVRNDTGRYQGDLRYYFNVLFSQAKNLNSPYHNFRHMTHVLWLCHSACVFYVHELSKRQKRNLLIAAIFHDFNHRGKPGPDILNIRRALAAFDKYILPKDRLFYEDIETLIRATEYPHKVPSSDLDLSAKILRDADVAQALSPVWMQQVVFGLAKEWGKSPLEVLKMQETFQKNLEFETEWARLMFPRSEIDQKIAEAKEYMELLALETASV